MIENNKRLNGSGYFLFPSNHYIIINTVQEEHMMTPDATLPSIIFFGVEISTLPKTIRLASFLLCILDDSSYDGCRSNNDLI